MYPHRLKIKEICHIETVILWILKTLIPSTMTQRNQPVNGLFHLGQYRIFRGNRQDLRFVVFNLIGENHEQSHIIAFKPFSIEDSCSLR